MILDSLIADFQPLVDETTGGVFAGLCLLVRDKMRAAGIRHLEAEGYVLETDGVNVTLATEPGRRFTWLPDPDSVNVRIQVPEGESKMAALDEATAWLQTITKE